MKQSFKQIFSALFFVLGIVGCPNSLAVPETANVFIGEESKDYEYEDPSFLPPIILASLLTAWGYELHHDTHHLLATLHYGMRHDASYEVGKAIGTTLMIIGATTIVYVVLKNVFPKRTRAIFKKNNLTYEQKNALIRLLKDIGPVNTKIVE